MLDIALIHRARVITTVRGSLPDAQGSRQESAGEPVAGPWVDARVMERGGPSGGRRQDGSSLARTSRGYEVLLSPEIDGAPWGGPPAGARIETDCGVLGSPTIDLDGRPEVLNDGEDLIGFLAYGRVPGDAS